MIAPVNLLLVAALAGLLALCVLGSLARSGMAGIKQTIGSSLLTLLAFGAFSLQAVGGPLFISVILANAAVALALCAYYAGLCRLVGQPVPRRRMALGAGATLLVLAAYTYIEPQIGARMVAMSILMAGFMLAIAVTVGRGMPSNRSRYSYHFVRVVALASALVCAARAVVYLLDIAEPQALLVPTAWNIVFMTLGVLTMPCLTLGTIMIIHDRMLAEREQEANTDFLTGLMSRKAWWLQAERYCAQALRTRRPLSLLLLDIDHFKRINDTRGHAAGDAVLRHFGLLATATLRTGDHVGRVGGEEFAVLFPDLRSEAVMEVAARLLESVRRTPCAHGGSSISYTFSAGVAEWMPGEGLQAFFERADGKLYAAKAAGRNRIVGPAGEGEPAPLPAAA
ncbi:diguanylate cyclase [Achromobacter sp. HZ01]|jgi:diguanylate cyclase (GGDEF)-like protein|uniref:diguanylate cyclase n=1 Tax=Achromobacter pulmonis TaxID=1389932 RepID=A0A2N8KNI5_9BURK|nr:MULTISPECIES: GGDEF domain-containing protein [Achromobacter]MBO9331083.1 diguanylate cyclase [Achromobacter xylosoxidans]PND35022.1 GGDEF domain-containing protein [Achromobacter pulmonis]RAP65586.1 diguanylate cyclase [Achromobacter sp. HZ01]